jgi:hypothetical protein
MKKTLTVKYLGTASPDGKPRWQVVTVKNSLTPRPDDVLTKEHMDDYINLGLFDVTVISGKEKDQ